LRWSCDFCSQLYLRAIFPLLIYICWTTPDSLEWNQFDYGVWFFLICCQIQFVSILLWILAPLYQGN
jgi:hypothetical protein